MQKSTRLVEQNERNDGRKASREHGIVMSHCFKGHISYPLLPTWRDVFVVHHGRRKRSLFVTTLSIGL